MGGKAVSQDREVSDMVCQVLRYSYNRQIAKFLISWKEAQGQLLAYDVGKPFNYGLVSVAAFFSP